MEDWDCSLHISAIICQEDQAFFDDANGDEKKEIEHESVLSVLLNDSEILGAEDEYIEILVSRESSLEKRDCAVFCREDSSGITDCSLKWARSDAIQWIMKTRAYFGFSYQTAYLAVTYYDRFLMQRCIDKGKSWVVPLLSIACLSLAAKMEEYVVPPLSEFPSEECKFNGNTIQRMELLILSTLEWRMNSVTPFSYLNYFTSKIQINTESKEFLSKSTGFIFAIIDDINSVDYRPSTIAAAAVLAASNQRLNKQLVESKLTIFSCGTLDPEHVFSCYTLMIEESRNSSSVGDNKSLSTRNKRLQK